MTGLLLRLALIAVCLLAVLGSLPLDSGVGEIGDEDELP